MAKWTKQTNILKQQSVQELYNNGMDLSIDCKQKKEFKRIKIFQHLNLLKNFTNRAVNALQAAHWKFESW